MITKQFLTTDIFRGFEEFLISDDKFKFLKLGELSNGQMDTILAPRKSNILHSDTLTSSYLCLS